MTSETINAGGTDLGVYDSVSYDSVTRVRGGHSAIKSSSYYTQRIDLEKLLFVSCGSTSCTILQLL